MPIPTTATSASTTIQQDFTPDGSWFDTQMMDATARLSGPVTLKCTVTPFNSTTGTFANQSQTLSISDVYKAAANPDLPELAAKLAADLALGNAMVNRFIPARQADLAAAMVPLNAAKATLATAQANQATAQAAVQAAYEARNAIAPSDPAYAVAQTALLVAQQAANEAALPVATAQQAVTAAQANAAIATAAFDPAMPRLVLPA